MEHIIQIAVSVDDDRIAELAEQAAANEIVKRFINETGGYIKREMGGGMTEHDHRRTKRICRMEYDPVHCDYICTSCGERYEADMHISISGDDRHFFKPMRYCPNCGAMVIDSERRKACGAYDHA